MGSQTEGSINLFPDQSPEESRQKRTLSKNQNSGTTNRPATAKSQVDLAQDQVNIAMKKYKEAMDSLHEGFYGAKPTLKEAVVEWFHIIIDAAKQITIDRVINSFTADLQQKTDALKQALVDIDKPGASDKEELALVHAFVEYHKAIPRATALGIEQAGKVLKWLAMQTAGVGAGLKAIEQAYDLLCDAHRLATDLMSLANKQQDDSNTEFQKYVDQVQNTKGCTREAAVKIVDERYGNIIQLARSRALNGITDDTISTLLTKANELYNIRTSTKQLFDSLQKEQMELAQKNTRS